MTNSWPHSLKQKDRTQQGNEEDHDWAKESDFWQLDRLRIIPEN